MAASTTNQLFDLALSNMENSVHGLTLLLPLPREVPFLNSYVFRHVEQTIHQAIVQKLARLVSTLSAARLLLEHGFYQEQGALQRILDELIDDITFLCIGVIKNDLTDLHSRYLKVFFQEEFDSETPMKSSQKRDLIPRARIHAYNARQIGPGLNPSTAAELFRTVSKANSGFVHAASPHIMDMYGGSPAKFHVRGMLTSGRQAGHERDLWNYFYRGIVAFSLSARSFGDRILDEQI